jgi:transcriptional regulator with XRE-family HTH domain
MQLKVNVVSLITEHMAEQKRLPIPAERALRKLGEDIKDARRRQRIPTRLMTERAGMARATLTKIEKGDPTVSIGGYASVLFVLGMVHRLQDLADGSQDLTGRELADERLPKRIRLPRNQSPHKQDVSEATDEKYKFSQEDASRTHDGMIQQTIETNSASADVIQPDMARILTLKTETERLRIAWGMWRSARNMIERLVASESPELSPSERQSIVAQRLSGGT